MYIARGQHPCLAWQGTVLYEDGAKISEVGIKDGCSVHLAIYFTEITVTTLYVGPDFKIYLPDDVSNCLIYLCFCCCYDNLRHCCVSSFILNPLSVRCEPAQGEDLQDHQHPPRAPEDQV